jgi:hypothetical protein
MNLIYGFKGFTFNLLLVGLFFLISTYLEAVNIVKDDFKMPLYVILFFVPFLLLEYKANECILSHEFQKMSEPQTKVWSRFIKTWFFGIFLLMLLIWRTYFKMELLLLPLWYKIYSIFGYSYNTLVWSEKIPVYMTGALIVYGECILIKNTLLPQKLPSSILKVWLYRIVLLVSIAFYITGLIEIFRKTFYKLNFDNFFLHLPLLTIIFIFFYVPLRWVEIISDVVDCQNSWQLWLFWLSTFFGMVIMLM